MRPQHITAENARRRASAPGCGRASMRPQHITAENLSVSAGVGWIGACFNEAAAYHCGKRVGLLDGGF